MNSDIKPDLSFVIPTFNNLAILKTCLESWERYRGRHKIELLVIEDGCSDGTADYLREKVNTDWGRRCLRWFHEDDRHALRCTNRGFAEARADLMLAWQDDMYLLKDWFVDELVQTMSVYPEIGLLALSRALNFAHSAEPIHCWEDLHHPKRLTSTIGPRPWNWFRIQEVDGVIRPWVVRRQCLETVGKLDEAFVPDEWDETDLCYRIRQAGWKIAVHGYERVGAYFHLGSSTLTREPSEKLKRRVLPNGKLFYDRWAKTIQMEQHRNRKTWTRKATLPGWLQTVRTMTTFALAPAQPAANFQVSKSSTAQSEPSHCS